MKINIAKFIWGKPVALLFCAALIFLASCMDDDSPAVEAVPHGFVSIYHAAPDAPPLDILVDNSKVNGRPFNYASFSGYLNFKTGSRNVKFNSVNAASALADVTFDVAEGKAYSLFVINTLSGIESLVVADNAAVPAAGKAMIRFVHLSPDAPVVNVGVQDGTSLFDNTSFKHATEFKEVDAKLYSFDIKSATTGEVVLSAKDITIEQGGYYTIVTRGFANPPAGNTNVLSVEIL